MIHQDIQSGQQTQSQATFVARKEILRALSEAQAKEHVLYGDVARSVGTHMKALCQAWIDLLLNDVRHSGPDKVGRLSTAAGIPYEQLDAWCSAQRAYDQAEIQLSDAQKALAAAKLERSKFAGILWGAKDGCALQYAAADTNVEKTKKELDRQERQAVEATRTLDALSEKLLRNCIKQSALVATSTEFGLVVGGVLDAMQAEARSLGKEHDQAQRELLAKIADSLNALNRHYRNR
jgi:hypothetical protein